MSSSRRRSLLNHCLWRRILCTALVAVGAASLKAQGLDIGKGATGSVEVLPVDGVASDARGRVWLRVRGLSDPAKLSPDVIQTQRDALAELRRRGYRLCSIQEPGAGTWQSGVRSSPRAKLPLDLREAFQRLRRVHEAYGDLVDFWEIDNEPDIPFVPDNPETYTAYLKACWWGAAGGGRSAVDGGRRARVMMAPLALPPGPWFEAFLANDGLSYTDAFNYHYYGYAEDFSGVYRQFENAAKGGGATPRRGEMEDGRWGTVGGGRSAVDSGRGTGDGGRSTGYSLPATVTVAKGWTTVSWLAAEMAAARRERAGWTKKDLPVFLTEYGYGMLDGQAQATVEGRVRQWRWFRDVGGQIRGLRIEGPMAFLLVPYLEYKTKEFGLTAAAPAAAGERAGDGYRAGGLTFTPADFGASGPEPWMERIGARFGDFEAMPALAWLAEDAAKPRRPSRSWSVQVPPPCPVVIDFVAGPGLSQTKQGQGYFLAGERAHTGEVRVYNFGSEAIAGTLDLGEPARHGGRRSLALTLTPGEMRVLPVEILPTTPGLTTRRWEIAFVPARGRGVGRFQTKLRGWPALGSRHVLQVLTGADAGARNVRALAARPLATDEPPETIGANGWSCTRGVAVTETADIWTIAISQLPAEPTRPAIAELVLPDDFHLEPDHFIDLAYRVAPDGPATGPSPTGADSEVLRNSLIIAWRTANGNLYTVWRPPAATETWQRYAQRAASFTMGFYGRANPPWRFAENRPVSLVFMFLPGTLPSKLEVRRAEIVGY